MFSKLRNQSSKTVNFAEFSRNLPKFLWRESNELEFEELCKEAMKHNILKKFENADEFRSRKAITHSSSTRISQLKLLQNLETQLLLKFPENADEFCSREAKIHC